MKSTSLIVKTCKSRQKRAGGKVITHLIIICKRTGAIEALALPHSLAFGEGAGARCLFLSVFLFGYHDALHGEALGVYIYRTNYASCTQGDHLDQAA